MRGNYKTGAPYREEAVYARRDCVDEYANETDGKIYIENSFLDIRLDLVSEAAGVRFTPAFDVSAAEALTFFVKNRGAQDFEFNIQLSPDGAEFLDDKQICTVGAGELKAITPYLFGRFMRAKIAASSGGASAAVWIQARTADYALGCR